MKVSGTPGQRLASISRLLIVAGAVCLSAAMVAGFAGTIGAFRGDADLPALTMTFLCAIGSSLVALGVKNRRAARLAGWKPAWETPASTTRPSDASLAHRESETDASTLASAPIDDGASPALSAETPRGTAQSPAEKNRASGDLPTSGSAFPDGMLDDPSGGLSPSTFSNFPKRPAKGSRQSDSIPREVAKERIETVRRMLLRSDSIFATAKDLIASGQTIDAFADLSAMLAQCDAMKLDDPPVLKPIRLSRNNRYWLGGDVFEAPDEVYDAVISLEAAFNLCQDIIEDAGEHPGEVHGLDAKGKALRVLSSVSKAKPNYITRSEAFDLAYPDAGDSSLVSEWGLRMNIANAAENAALPFRIVFDMKTNAAEALALICLQVPRPTCFSIVSSDEQEQQALARDYAFRSALFMAKTALNAPQPGRNAIHVVVTCHERQKESPLLSMEATRESLRSLESIARCIAPIESFQHPDVKVSWDNAWLDPVDPHLETDDPLLNPERYDMHVELSDQPCTERLADATNSSRESNLGVVEGAARRQAWMQLEGRLGNTVESAVAAVMELQSATNDPAIGQACSQVMHALVEGTVEPNQLEQIEAIFMGDDTLREALSLGARAYITRQEPDIEHAVSTLTAALTPSMQIRLMDDTESVFRHFRNTAERLMYNLHFADKREIHIVPRIYYAANEMTAHLLCMLNRPEEAEPYVDEIMRIAPISANAAVTKARVLEDLSRLFEAESLINDTILDAPTVSDAALCYYRMAYLQWKTGRHDVASACYRVSIYLQTSISAQAQTELDDLLQSDDGLEDYSIDDAKELLKANGVNIWPLEDRRVEIAKAAVLCADEQIYPAAQQLGMALLEFRHDDALIDVCRSFG